MPPCHPPSDERKRAIDDLNLIAQMAEDLANTAEGQSDPHQAEIYREQARLLRDSANKTLRKMNADARRATFRIVSG